MTRWTTQKYRSAFGAGARGDGWYSFDIAGVHVIALVNTPNLKKLGHLGVEQLDFVAKDVAALPSDTPIIVFSHIPLFAMYPDWGWGTDDSAQALSYLRRFSSVTCLKRPCAPGIFEGRLVQASISFALALLILTGGPSWLRWAAAALAGSSLVAFVLSRTVGLLGFSEQGWQPYPHAVISVVAEILAIGLWAAYVLVGRNEFISRKHSSVGRTCRWQ
jgi:hypothetical protein